MSDFFPSVNFYCCLGTGLVPDNIQPTEYNSIDRPTKHSLPLTKLTNLSSEWKVGVILKIEEKFYSQLNYFFNFLKIIEFKFVLEVCILK